MSAKYQAYPEYKDSGVEWLGGLPAVWGTSFIKHWLFQSPCYGVLKPDGYEGNDAVPVIRIMDVSNGAVACEELAKISPKMSKEYKRTLIQSGDLIVSVVGTLGRTFICTSEHEGMNLSRALARLQVKRNISTKYVDYLIGSQCFEDYVSVTCTGAAQKVLNMEDVSNWAVPSPSFEEQKQIAVFLDHETAEIDTLIDKQKKLIALLKEKRQATISHAVTKGINPNAPMKDSGIPWLGKIPAHWVERPLKFMAQIKNGRDYKHVEVNEGEGYPVIGSGGEFTRASDFLFSGSSVLLGRKGTIDKPLYIEGAFWTVDTMYYTDIAKNTLPKYLYYCALTIPFDYYSTNTALPSMTQGDLGNHLLLYPPFEEQREIVCFIEEKTAQIDKLVSKAEQAIELIQERRTALISAAVTGKIDARSHK